MRKSRVDIITHVLKALAFGCMAQALALRLNVIGFGFDYTVCKRRMIQLAVVALRVIFYRNLPIALIGNFDPFKRL